MLVLSHVWLLATPWTVTHQTPLSLGFCRQEYWTGLPFPPPEDLPNPGIKSTSPVSPALQEDSLPAEPIVKHLTQCMLGCFSHVWLFVTPWTVAHKAPLSMGFSGKNTGVGCHFLLQGIFPTRGSSLHWHVGSLPLAPPGKPIWLNRSLLT